MKKINPHFEKKFIQQHNLMDGFVKTEFEGKIVVWKKGRYRGRKAYIRYASWERNWCAPERIEIQVVVETERKDGKGYMNARDIWHRNYRDVYEWFKDAPKETP